MKPFYRSLATFGTIPTIDAVRLSQEVGQSILGVPVRCDKLQICPQNRRGVNDEIIAYLLEVYPDIEFRLHANVNVTGLAKIVDASNWPDDSYYFGFLKKALYAIKSPVYTLHAGRRSNCSLEDLFAKVKDLEDSLGIPTGVEGHYPDADNKWLINSWKEYEAMLNSGVNFALDLSHLNIVGYYEQVYPLDLVKAMIESERCIEVHISHNEGYSDSHRNIIEEPWWWQSLQFINPSADIFTEGFISTQVFIN